MSATTWASSGSLSRQFDVFLSYNNRDEASVERIAQRLKRAGLEPWLDKWSLTPGGEWQRELGAGMDASLACAVFVGEHDLGAWELQELAVAIDRAATQQGFRVFPVLLPGVDDPFDPNRLPHFLRARTWVDFRRGRNDSRALQDLINAVKGVPFGPDVPIVPNVGVAPYLGLQVFGEEDAQFFFGRDGEIQRLREKLKSSRFVAVLGPSGSGKSSLVQAGLVPALRAGARAQGERLRVCVLRPGAAPLTVLAAQLARLLPGQAMQATVDALAQDARTLHPEFAQLVGTQQMLVGSMNTDGLRQAIEQPAHRVGLELEQGLSDTILADVGAEPGALPLLEHALLELWERRRGAILTLEGYVRAGGVHGALAQRAEEIYGQLSPDQQQIVRRALLRLTQPGQGTEDTRRRALRDELAPIDGHDDFEVVLSRLVDARLLIAGRDETGKEVVDAPTKR